MEENKLKTIKQLKAIFNAEQFIITGSTILELLGLTDKSLDIDILLYKPNNNAGEFIKKMMENYPAKTKPTGVGDLKGIFMYNGYKIDVFFIKEKRKTININNDYDITTVDEIIKAKKKYNRIKDWLQLRKISNLFFNETEFNKFLDSADPTNVLNNDDEDYK
jgi:hypothetical protein